MGPIILCHAHEDKKAVWQVYDALIAAEFEAYLDLDSLSGGQEWEHNLPDWLGRASCLLIFLSKNAVRKIGALHHDFGQIVATWKELPKGAVHTIPVRINDCEIPDMFGGLHHIDLFEAHGLEDIISRLREAKSEQPPFAAGSGTQAPGPGNEAPDDELDGVHVAVDGKGEVVGAPCGKPCI